MQASRWGMDFKNTRMFDLQDVHQFVLKVYLFTVLIKALPRIMQCLNSNYLIYQTHARISKKL